MKRIDPDVVERPAATFGAESIVVGSDLIKGECAHEARDLTECSGASQLDDSPHSRMPPGPDCLDENHAGVCGIGEDRGGLVLGKNERLLAQHVLAGRNAGPNPRQVSLIREADVDGIDTGVINDGLVVVVAVRGSRALGPEEVASPGRLKSSALGMVDRLCGCCLRQPACAEKSPVDVRRNRGAH